MNKKVTGLLLCIFLTGVLFADLSDEFSNLVDFSTTFGILYQQAQKSGVQQYIDGKLIIIDGSVVSRTVVNKEEQDFLAELELINGKWIGLEEVEVYKCYVQLKGPEFSSRIPARRTRNKLPNEIELNSRVIVVGRVVSFRKDRTGSVLPVIEALFVRTL